MQPCQAVVQTDIFNSMKVSASARLTNALKCSWLYPAQIQQSYPTLVFRRPTYTCSVNVLLSQHRFKCHWFYENHILQESAQHAKSCTAKKADLAGQARNNSGRDYECIEDDEKYMSMAIEEAKIAARQGEVPVGAVVVVQGTVISRAHNRVECERDPTAHAEMQCIREAATQIDGWRLSDATMYVTLEPCPMCAGAILQSRVGRLVWGARNTLLGADGSWVRLFPSVEAVNNTDSGNINDSGNNNDDGNNNDNGKNNEIVPDVNPTQVVGPVHPFHPNIEVTRGVLSSECSEIMRQFFRNRRKDPRYKNNIKDVKSDKKYGVMLKSNPITKVRAWLKGLFKWLR